MTHSKIKDVWSDGTIYLEDGSHFGTDIDTEGPFVTFGSGRVYLAVGQLIGHAPLEGKPQAEASDPQAGPRNPPDEGNHPTVQSRVSQ